VTVTETANTNRVIVLDIVGLQPQHLSPATTPHLSALSGDNMASLRPPFPAVTVPSQTTLATGRSPAAHGDVANGSYDRESDTVTFWDRDRGERDRLWETASEAGLQTGVLFFQHLKGTTADVALTPSPIEDENNDLVEMNCWSNPDGFYEDLAEEYGHFPLHNYWGPLAGREGTEWILTAASEAIDRYDPDLLWVYIPHLDYVGLREGPGPAFQSELEVVDALVGNFIEDLHDDRWQETTTAVVSEYGFYSVDRPLFPNRTLKDAGLLSVTDTGDVDLSNSQAFALVDHQIAHVYADRDDIPAVRSALQSVSGIAEIRKPTSGDYHPNTGDLVLVAERNAWFQYYWWHDEKTAPPYASDVDIHAKPGFDPCELFLGDAAPISLDSTQVGGSHGRTDTEGHGIFGLGGPAAPDIDNGQVDARAVAPTIAELLDIRDVDASFEGSSVV